MFKCDIKSTETAIQSHAIKVSDRAKNETCCSVYIGFATSAVVFVLFSRDSNLANLEMSSLKGKTILVTGAGQGKKAPQSVTGVVTCCCDLETSVNNFNLSIQESDMI